MTDKEKEKDKEKDKGGEKSKSQDKNKAADKEREENIRIGIVPFSQLPTYYTFNINQRRKIIFTADVILHFVQKLYNKQKVLEKHVMRVTRNADITVDEGLFDFDIDFRGVDGGDAQKAPPPGRGAPCVLLPPRRPAVRLSVQKAQGRGRLLQHPVHPAGLLVRLCAALHAGPAQGTEKLVLPRGQALVPVDFAKGTPAAPSIT